MVRARATLSSVFRIFHHDGEALALEGERLIDAATHAKSLAPRGHRLGRNHDDLRRFILQHEILEEDQVGAGLDLALDRDLAPVIFSRMVQNLFDSCGSRRTVSQEHKL